MFTLFQPIVRSTLFQPFSLWHWEGKTTTEEFDEAIVEQGPRTEDKNE